MATAPSLVRLVLVALLVVGGASASAATIVGTNGKDILRGTNRGDRIYGKAGNDLLGGRGYPDKLWGGSGNDDILGGDGLSFLGIDWLWGGSRT
jgi:Ca2+-binding RTX toxin-like protein